MVSVTSLSCMLYRYRKYTLKDGLGLIVRCEHNTVLPPTSSNHSPDQLINIKSLNEWDPKVSHLSL